MVDIHISSEWNEKQKPYVIIEAQPRSHIKQFIDKWRIDTAKISAEVPAMAELIAVWNGRRLSLRGKHKQVQSLLPSMEAKQRAIINIEIRRRTVYTDIGEIEACLAEVQSLAQNYITAVQDLDTTLSELSSSLCFRTLALQSLPPSISTHFYQKYQTCASKLDAAFNLSLIVNGTWQLPHLEEPTVDVATFLS